MKHHFLQSTAWQAFQEALGRTTFRQSGDGWEFLAFLEHGTGNTRLHCPYGPTASSPEAFAAAIDALTQLARQQQVTFVRIESPSPEYNDTLTQLGWKRAAHIHINPERTSIVDLTQDEPQILTRMAQPVRSRWRNHQKKGMQIRQSTDPADIALFLRLIHEVSERTGMNPHSDAYYTTQAQTLFPLGAASLWYVTHNDVPIASAIFYDDDDTRYYAHAAASSNPEYRSLNAGTPLIAEALFDAKRRGLTRLDLCGIAPEGAPASHPWAGFTKFKRSFGGDDLSYGGIWELPLQPAKYWLYRAYQKLRG